MRMLWQVIDTVTSIVEEEFEDYYVALGYAMECNLDANDYQRFVVQSDAIKTRLREPVTEARQELPSTEA
jgi:hypothetical protein